MSARQERVREALGLAYLDIDPRVQAALGEVEEWERWLALADADRERLSGMVGVAERAYEKEKARAEAAEAELQHFRDCADTPLMRDVIADRDEARRELAERDGTVGRWQQAAEAAEQEGRIVAHQLERRTQQLAEAEAERDRLREALAGLMPWAGKQTFDNDAAWVNARAALCYAGEGA